MKAIGSITTHRVAPRIKRRARSISNVEVSVFERGRIDEGYFLVKEEGKKGWVRSTLWCLERGIQHLKEIRCRGRRLKEDKLNRDVQETAGYHSGHYICSHASNLDTPNSDPILASSGACLQNAQG